MICAVTGSSCRLVSRDHMMARVGVAQCLDCSTVYEAIGWQPRRCGACGLLYGESLHDPCLGELPNVTEACCGHGDPARAYRVENGELAFGDYQLFPVTVE